MATFVEILQSFDVPYLLDGHHHCREGWVQLPCPWCGSNNWHLGFCFARGSMNCYRCGPHQVLTTLRELTDQPSGKLKKLLMELDVDVGVGPAERFTRSKLELPIGIGKLLPAHRAYLRGRNYDPKELKEEWNIQGIGPGSTHQWSIFIPITCDGETVSWETRTIGQGSARYRAARSDQERIPRKTLLYGEQHTRHSIVVVEGTPSVWRIGRGSTATFGIAYTKAQVLRISKYPIRAICFDNEPKAQAQAKRLCRELEVFDGETYNVVLNSRQPSEASPKELEKLRKRFLDIY